MTLRQESAAETRSPTSSMLSRLPQICVVSRIPGLRAALDAHGVNTAAMEWHAELDSAAAQQSLARCEVSRRAENSSTQPWASWLALPRPLSAPKPSAPADRPVLLPT